MENVKDLAFKKMLEEMKSNESSITERLHVWLCNQNDLELFHGVIKEDRTLHGATEYCYAQGSKIAQKGVADVTPEMEQMWCKEYFTKDEIKSFDLKILPPKSGERVEVEVVKEVEKVVYKDPTFEEIGEYLAQQKQKSKKSENQDERMSLFDWSKCYL